MRWLVSLLVLLSMDSTPKEIIGVYFMEPVEITATQAPDWTYDFVIEYLKAHEGFRANPYICPAGYLTVGYGDQINHRSENKTWSESEAAAKLKINLAKKEAWIVSTIPLEMKEHQKLALAALAFNCRMHSWKTSGLKKLVEQHLQAPDDIALRVKVFKRWQMWSTINGVPCQSLRLRRTLEANLFIGNWDIIRENYGQYIPADCLVE